MQMYIREIKYKKINLAVIIIYFTISILLLLYYVKENKAYNYMQAFIAIALLIVPFAVNKISKIQMTADVSLIYFLFCFLTIIVGSLLSGYTKIPYWDKFLHFLSGIVFTVFGFLAFYIISGRDCYNVIHNRKLIICFAFFFNIGFAGLWEIYEYGLYVFFGVDAMNMHRTLANDTMQDMIMCVLGGIMLLTYNRICTRFGRSNFFLNTCKHFLIYNDYITDQNS